MFALADKDKDGKLSYKEFQVRQDQGTEISDMFIFADKDKDGKLSYKEVQVRQDQGTEMSDRGHVYLCGQGQGR